MAAKPILTYPMPKVFQQPSDYVGESWSNGTYRITVTTNDSFGCTPHLGVSFTLDGVQYGSGWVPVALFLHMIEGMQHNLGM